MQARNASRTTTFVAAVVAIAGVMGALTLSARGPIPSKPDRTTIAHVLDRIAFGARPGDIERVRAMGLSTYIELQLHPDRIADTALDARLGDFPTLTMTSRDLAERYFLPALMLRRNQQLAQQASGAGAPAANPGVEAAPEMRQAQMKAQSVANELMQARMLRAAMSERQLEEVLTDFWFNHFNVSITKGQVRQYVTEYERDAIRPHVFGHFRDMLGAVAHSPAMLFYLDNWQSAAPDSSRVAPEIQRRLDDSRLRPDQRRRLLERLEQRRADAKRPARGLNENYAREIMELHTLGVDGGYTQKDVTELARILTGWTIDRPQQGGAFVFRAEMHDRGTKTFLGVTFHDDGEKEGERALDLLAAHPATARHVAFQLAQRFVADEPPAALVDHAARTFAETKGDLRAVVRAIITSPEFFAEDARRAKIKTPLEFVVSSVRATGASVANAQPLVAAMRTLGMPLYSCEPPTGYGMTSDAWVNTGSLLNRMNFAVQLVSGGRPAQRAPVVDLAALAPDTSERTREALVDTLLNGQASAATKETLARAENPRTLVALALGSPEFQRR